MREWSDCMKHPGSEVARFSIVLGASDKSISKIFAMSMSTVGLSISWVRPRLLNRSRNRECVLSDDELLSQFTDSRLRSPIMYVCLNFFSSIRISSSKQNAKK